LLQFVDSVGKNFETFKSHYQELQELRKAFNGRHFDDYTELLKRLGGFSNNYKHNIRELIAKFARMRAELNNREGTRVGRLESQPREDEGPDLESEYIERLHKLCVFFDKNKLEELRVFSKIPLDIFTPADIAAATGEI